MNASEESGETNIELPIGMFDGAFLPELVRRQHKVLSDMFSDPGLEQLRNRHPGHPAVLQFDRLGKLAVDGLDWPNEFDATQALSQVGLDFSAWAPEPPYPEFWSFLDEDTKNWTVSMIEDPSQYQDVMAELFFWGWLKEQGTPVVRRNLDGQADLFLGPNGEWPCEVKRIHLGSGPERIRKVITKANKQIKASSPKGTGSVFVSIERLSRRLALDDRVPNDITPFVEVAEVALRDGQHRGVAQVTIAWDDVMMLGEPPGPTFYAFRRCSVVVEHPQPRSPSPYSAAQLEVGRTMAMRVDYEGPPKGRESPPLDAIETAEVNVSSLFRQQNEFADGVRANHAIEVMSEPDDMVIVEYAETEMAFATRHITLGGVPYVLLVIAVRGDGGKWEVVGGYRLYRSNGGGDLGADALKAFSVLIDRYGLDVQVGGRIGKFIPHAVTAPGSGVRFPEGTDEYSGSCLIKAPGDDWAEYRAVYVLDTGKYRAALRKKES